MTNEDDDTESGTPHIFGIGDTGAGKRDLLGMAEMTEASGGDAPALVEAFKRTAFDLPAPGE
ncbi:hypothetical protein E3G45_005027 [Mycobacteroides abscessus]|uniref:hypothetical protein n=1 Tax=Mycobacteroides abscessus TaxID=36809 RepID=UPI0018786638|nr:hypothetical protein [Mycobacteroides abscessus]